MNVETSLNVTKSEKQGRIIVDIKLRTKGFNFEVEADMTELALMAVESAKKP